MSHKNKLSLVAQVQCALETQLAIGQSKHADKALNATQDKIYAWSTFRDYMKHANYFAAYCKREHHCRTLAECRPYVDEWLLTRSELSAYTQKLEAAALAKLYGCSTKDFVQTKTRRRADITRSRGTKARDKHFSEANHRDFVEFCKSTGLSRSELAALTGNKLKWIGSQPYIVVDAGSKGGRYREAPVTGNVDLVVRYMQTAGSGKVFDKVPCGADVHSYRSDYATAIYKQHARDIKDIPYDAINKGTGRLYQSQVYHCRGDLKDTCYDKMAMLKASQALGLKRINAVSDHYLNSYS